MHSPALVSSLSVLQAAGKEKSRGGQSLNALRSSSCGQISLWGSWEWAWLKKQFLLYSGKKWKKGSPRCLHLQHSRDVGTNTSGPFGISFYENHILERSPVLSFNWKCTYSNLQLASIIKTVPSPWVSLVHAERPVRWRSEEELGFQTLFVTWAVESTWAVPQRRSEEEIGWGYTSDVSCGCSLTCGRYRAPNALSTVPCDEAETHSIRNITCTPIVFSSVPVCTVIPPVSLPACIIACESSWSHLLCLTYCILFKFI